MELADLEERVRLLENQKVILITDERSAECVSLKEGLQMLLNLMGVELQSKRLNFVDDEE